MRRWPRAAGALVALGVTLGVLVLFLVTVWCILAR